MRLIDADALRKKVQKVATEAWKMKITALVETIINQFIEFITDAPTIEAEPVRHGRWVEVWDYNYMQYFHQCSECGRDALTKDETMHDEVLSFYCPYCGAKMGKKEEPACD